MPLSRLDNFLKNVRGNIIYVNPNDLDATDAVENQGNSLGRPFITIQRALIEAARFSYQQGLDNDRFGKTTVVLYPGEHVVDNRPGFIPDDSVSPIRYIERQGTTTLDFPPFSTTSDFNLTSTNNILYKLNSVFGGVIVPRGVSIVGLDVRKTKIRPLYVPSGTPSMLNAVSTSKPARPVAISTVIVSVAVEPSPALILLTFTSPLRGPMILNSSVLG